MDTLQPHPKPVRLLYFWVGILATFFYRLIIVLNFYSATWVKIAWYVGTIGFILYFIHRFQVSEKRARVIERYHLAEKVPKLSELNEEERQAMSYLFQTLRTSREKWNYIFIFTMSGLALAVGIAFDLFGVG